jgi:hypothetical protein
MNLGRHLSFANVASATALSLVLGGGVAVAAGLAPNSVGSKQIKSQAVKSSDIKKNAVKGKHIKNNTVTGKDVKESSLGTVPSVETVRVGGTVTAAVGATPVTVHTEGPLTISLRCLDGGGGTVQAFLEIRTSADNAFVGAAPYGVTFGDFDVFQGPQPLASTSSVSPAVERVSFVAGTAVADTALQGTGFVGSKLGGSPGCSTQLTFLG